MLPETKQHTNNKKCVTGSGESLVFLLIFITLCIFRPVKLTDFPRHVEYLSRNAHMGFSAEFKVNQQTN